jgi:putative MFS transporter
MSASPRVDAGQAHPVFFWLGTSAVTLGVAFHLPMYIDAAAMNFHLAGMPFDWRMLTGMALIGVGTAAGWYGLLPAARMRGLPNAMPAKPAAPEAAGDAGKLRWVHWRLLLVLALALIIDSMKPASLGFTIPGMSQEYALPREVVALLPFLALTGLTIGSYVWGAIGDQVGRRSAILLSGIMFVGTAICGAMPGFLGNLIMCFFMGLAAGGMLPITYALLAECLPSKHRGWAMVLLGGLGLVGGFFAASGCASLFEPYFGWRIMWFLNAPTGLVLILFNRMIPESPRFLLMRGRVEEAYVAAKRFGASLDVPQWSADPALQHHSVRAGILLRPPLRGTTATLNLVALAWGMINFGLLLWLPAELRTKGYGVLGSDVLLFRSALVALPTMFVVAWLYTRWSTKWTLCVLTASTALGLTGFALIDADVPFARDNPIILFSFLMVGVNGLIAVLLPYSAENYPVLVRGRGTGLVAGSSKLGGLAAQAATVAALVPGLGVAAAALAFPVAVSAALVAHYGKETRHRRLEDLDR